MESCVIVHDFLGYILYKLLRNDMNVAENEYKDICCDCMVEIQGYENQQLERAYKDLFCDDEEDDNPEPVSYWVFEGNIEEDEVWRTLYYNSILFREDFTKDVNVFLPLIKDFFQAMGLYLAKKFDDDVFKYGATYIFARMRIKAEKCGKYYLELIENKSGNELLDLLGLLEFNSFLKEESDI